ncbi:MAG: 3-oxoacyl-ACP synthase [Bacteroidales bacterium]|nr:3-oxoacyl-ACP synthase [Bacteroidales bacterium]
MVIKLADNIYSPLGATTWENYHAVMDGRTALRQYALPDGSRYTASLFPEEQRHDDGEYTFFEWLCIVSASDAIARAGIDPASSRVRFFLSTTKGNVHLLATGDTERALLGGSGACICRHFGNPNPPVVVSNACISGLSAQIAAMRSIEAGLCDTAVVIGCDVQSEFIISGFQCLHALSPDPCRPFDKDRCGLNLGEAAATIVYSHIHTFTHSHNLPLWVAAGGAMCNDANHISGPSRTGEGSYRCLQALDIDKEELAFVSVHGTSTLYNDEMESIALERAGLSGVPMFSLKGIYGHTMGAAGVLETILSMQAVEHVVVYGTRCFETLGVSRQVSVSAATRTTDKQGFVKLLSGFGGCNAAMKFRLTRDTGSTSTTSATSTTSPTSLISLRLSPTTEELVDLYRSEVGDYPKFFKMDPLSRLGFVASEMLLKKSPVAGYGVLLFNRSSSMADDMAFQATIQDKDNWFPSPALFVYTLPNIVTGEIAIRNHFQTETNFMVLDAPRPGIMAEQIALAARRGPQIAGWCEVDAAGNNMAALIAVPQDTPKETIEKELSTLLK